MSDTKQHLDTVCEVMAKYVDADTVKTARRRQSSVLAREEVDYLPIIFGNWDRIEPEDTKRLEGVPHYDWAEQWHDPAKSLTEQLRNQLGFVLSGGDSVPSVRADTGVINCMTIFGADYVVPEHTKPVISEYVPKEDLQQFEVPDDISQMGVMPRMVEHMEHHLGVLREHGLGDLVSVYHCDQQGPFDIAAQARGHDVFTDMYEDPPFVHDLMKKCTDVYIKVSKLCKQVNGESLDGGNAVSVWMKNGGVRMCGDSDILMSADQYREFVQKYQEEAFAAFSGGWLHYCGGWIDTGRSEGIHLHEAYSEVEGLRGLNWTTGKDWVAEMRKLKELGVVHIGGLRREDGEPLEEYLRRALSPYDERAGIIFQAMGIQGNAEEILATWRRLQEEKFG